MAWSTITFNQNGGTGGETRTLYINYSTSGLLYKINYFATAQSTSTSYRITSVTVPTKSEQLFCGYYFNNTDLVSSTGSLTNYTGVYMSTLPSGTLTARWQNYTKVTIGTNGGSGGTDIFYRALSDGRCYTDTALTTEITRIAKPKKFKYDFNGATYSSTQVIDATGEFTAAFRSMSITNVAITVTVQWVTATHMFGEVYDWFGLASSTLRLVSSESGDNKQRVCVSNATWSGSTQTGGAGKYETAVNETSPIWRNPTVTYEVVGDMTLNVTLGKGYAATNSGISKPTVSGYMITGVKVSTAIGKFPQVTISAVANEGYTQRLSGTTKYYTATATDAINTFALSLALLGRARAQNLMNAVSNGGQLQSCNLQATCTPVVVAEDMLPCASDVVGGQLKVDAVTYAPAAENAPTAGNGFTEVGTPMSCGGTNYLAWKFAAEKEMR